jgi:hypothetical protein
LDWQDTGGRSFLRNRSILSYQRMRAASTNGPAFFFISFGNHQLHNHPLTKDL